MKIVFLDKQQVVDKDMNWDGMEEFGEVISFDQIATEESPLIAERIGDADIVVVGKTPISRATMDKCPDLKAIAVHATGYNVVDCKAAREKGIPVMNVPEYGTQIVAQYTVGLLLEVCAHYCHHDQAMREGRWGADGKLFFWDYPLIELAGKTAGIIGLGHIGLAVARILKAMGMNIIANSPHESEAGREVAEYVDLDELYARADVILLHCPLFPENTDMINSGSIAKMKDGVILVNTSRGGLVVDRDLADALNSGKVSAAALDVISREPIEMDNPLLAAKNCLMTPHIAWVSNDARQRIIDTTNENVRSFIDGHPQNVVN